MAVRSAEAVTFLLTDIVGSTRLLARAGARYPDLVARHRALIGASAERHGGTAIPTQGDACLATFPSATAALRAAVDAQQALLSHDWGEHEAVRVRIGIHTGEAVRRDGEYFGLDLHLAARIADAGHGGQVLVSEATRALIAGAEPEDVRLLDLGLHRLKGLLAPLRLFQVEASGLPRSFPPLRARRGDAHNHNLPAPASPLVGRARELAEIAALLAHRRLVTLTGPGGVGKTRLALQAGINAVDDHPDGVWLVELTRARDAGAIPGLIAEPFGLELSDGTATALLAEGLRDKQALLVLDNFEHVVDAAAVVGALVERCPGLTVLATSRERLRVADEQVYPVPPLDLQGADRSSATSDAVALFVERARSHDQGFSPEADLDDIVAICDMTDGLPLAIELAAAQTRLLPVAAVRARLRGGLDALSGGPRDRPERHRALRTTISWSYRLLPPDEQRLFGRLAVFRGGRTIAAVRAVCGEGLDIDVLDGVTALVDKSMVQRRVGPDGETTLVLLELLHEFAGEALDAAPDADAVRARHAAYYADLAERADAGMQEDEALRWEAILNGELGNLRAALEWAFADGDVRQGIRIAAALYLFWFWGGPHEDGRRWVRLALDRDDLLDDATRARLHVAVGFFGFADSDMATTRRHWLQALAGFRRADDALRSCATLGLVAVSYAGEPGQHDHALRLADEAVVLARGLDGHWRVRADALNCKGEIARLAGDDATARACYGEALEVARILGDEAYIGDLQSNLAYVAVHEGDHEAALELALAGLEASWKAGKPVRVAWSLGQVADPELALGRPERAARLLGAADAALERMGVAWQPADQPEHDRIVAGLVTALGRQRHEAVRDEGARMSLEAAVAHALARGPASAASRG